MAKLFLILPCFLVIVFVLGVTSLPTPDEERYFDKEGQLNRELINLLNSVHYAQQLNCPCRYYSTNGLSTMSKRNSELINSLLSLPKNMNDAGK